MGFAPVKDGGSHAAGGHHRGNAPGNTDDKGYLQQALGAFHKGSDEVVLLHSIENADDDGCKEEDQAHLAKPPVAQRHHMAQQGPQHRNPQQEVVDVLKNGDAKLGRPGNYAKHHDDKGQGEDNQNHLPLVVQRRGFHPFIPLEVGLVLLPHIGNDADRGIRLYPFGIAHNIKNAGCLQRHKEEDPHAQAIADGDPRKTGCNAGREGVGSGRHIPDAGPQEDGHHSREGIVPCSQENGDNHQIECHRFLAHTKDGASQTKDDHQNGNHDVVFTIQLPHHRRDARIDGACFHNDLQEAAHDEQEQHNVRRLIKSVDRRHNHFPQALGIFLGFLIGAGNGFQAGSLRIYIIIGTCRNNPGQDCHRHNHCKQSDKRVWHLE